MVAQLFSALKVLRVLLINHFCFFKIQVITCKDIGKVVAFCLHYGILSSHWRVRTTCKLNVSRIDSLVWQGWCLLLANIRKFIQFFLIFLKSAFVRWWWHCVAISVQLRLRSRSWKLKCDGFAKKMPGCGRNCLSLSRNYRRVNKK